MAITPGIKHGIAVRSDKQGSISIKGDRGQEVDGTSGDDQKKGLKVHPTHSRPELSGGAEGQEPKE